MYNLLLAHDFADLRDLFHTFFASIPHDWYRKNQLAGYEGYYASIFYCYFAALGVDVTVVDATNLGQVDMAVRFGGRVLLFEFKVVEQTPMSLALVQLQEKRYAEKYQAEGVPVALIGVEFRKKSRNIVGFAVVDGEGEGGGGRWSGVWWWL